MQPTVIVIVLTRITRQIILNMIRYMILAPQEAYTTIVFVMVVLHNCSNSAHHKQSNPDQNDFAQ